MDKNVSEYLQSDKTAEPHHLTETMAKRRPNYKDVRPKDPSFRTKVPVDFHPDMLGNPDDTIAFNKGHAALGALYEKHTKIVETALAVTDRAMLAKQIEPVVLKALNAAKEEHAGLGRQIAHAEAEIAKLLGPGIGAIAQETRAVVRSLPEKERFNFVRELVAANDIESLKAIAAVSPFLSGINREVYDFARSEAEKLVAPKYVAERDTGRRAQDRLGRAIEDFDTTMAGNIKRWRASDEQKVANLLTSLGDK